MNQNDRNPLQRATRPLKPCEDAVKGFCHRGAAFAGPFRVLEYRQRCFDCCQGLQSAEKHVQKREQVHKIWIRIMK